MQSMTISNTPIALTSSPWLYQTHPSLWIPVHDYIKHTHHFDFQSMTILNTPTALTSSPWLYQTHPSLWLPVHDYIKHTHRFDFQSRTISNTPTALTSSPGLYQTRPPLRLISGGFCFKIALHILILCYYYAYIMKYLYSQTCRNGHLCIMATCS
jgi:hypothetical protein